MSFSLLRYQNIQKSFYFIFRHFLLFMNLFKTIIFAFPLFLLILISSCGDEKPKEIKKVAPPKEEVKPEPTPEPEIIEEHEVFFEEEAIVIPKTYWISEEVAYSVEIESYTKNCSTCDCGFAIEYPKVNGLEDENIQQKVNEMIKKRFLNSSLSCNDLKRGDTFRQKGSFKMALASQHILSFYAFVETYTANKRPTERFLFSFNLDLHSGKEITFESLFEHPSDVNAELKRYWNKMKFSYSAQDFKPKYEFYLTSKEIVFINLMREKGVTGDEAAIKYKYFIHEMNTNNILHELLEGEELH